MVEPTPTGPGPGVPNSYLVGSYLPFAPVSPEPPGPLPAAIRIVHRMVIVEASNEQVAVNFFAGWDNVPAGTRYFAVQIEPMTQTVATLFPADESQVTPLEGE